MTVINTKYHIIIKLRIFIIKLMLELNIIIKLRTKLKTFDKFVS